VKTSAGKDAGTVDLAPELFGVQPNVPVMHQVVTAQLSHRRSGTQSTKTRAEVRGGGKKPFRQKGTGNARQGSTRAPQFSGGGVALGPKPRSYSQKVNKKVVRLALASALSDRANDGKVLVVDSWGFDGPKTKDAVKLLSALGVDGTVLVVVGRDDDAAAKSFRNLTDVQLVLASELNAYDVLCNKYLLFTKDTLPVPSEKLKAQFARHAARAAGTDLDGETETTETGTTGLIKGNAQSMLYHVPGSRYYDVTKAEAWFATEEEAEAAGYSKAGSRDAGDES
jgi:large subunit ribosomal protein L4